MTPPPLTPIEARILAVLVEKSRTTPDVYPLTLNSLVAGCNQKTARDPVLNLAEAEVQSALEGLRQRALVLETYGASGRVLRYGHNVAKAYGLPAPAVDLLAVLMLRGPQTASELRANCERLHRFADSSAVEGYLDELASRPEAPLARLLPRQPGTRESRWTHLMCGDLALPEADPGDPVADDRVAALEARVDALERALEALRAGLSGA